MLECRPMSERRRVPDFVVIGSGPAGVSAGMTASSERINTTVLDDRPGVGGQASETSAVKNFPGFPHGITGAELMSRMIDQALGFNTQFRGPTRADTISATDEGIIRVGTDDGDMYEGRYVLISTGVERKALQGTNVPAFKGRGVTYGPPSSPESYENKTVVVIGAGNSAGQAAFKLSEYKACDVHMLIRGDNIEEHMSGYLIDDLQRQNVTVHTDTELTGVYGDLKLEKVSIKNNKTDETADLKADEVFVFIGAVPKTLWLPESIKRDPRGYIIAGSDLSDEVRGAFMEQTKGRKPLAHETSMPGVFVAGDVRAGTIKRIGSAVGDGIGVVPEIHALRSDR